MTETMIKIKLKLKDPRQVSIGHKRDQLTVKINLSLEQNTQNRKFPKTVLTKEIPGQVSSSETEKEVIA